ncbi:MAG: menaquinol-cytochrome C reductase [Dehalococcoidia bacterium]|nr:menaquinol-cytochrome C reductase [Dehalococcoidia bacterium]
MRGENQVFPKDPAKTYGLMELVKGTSPMVDKGPEDTVMAWPNLLILEIVVTLGTVVVLLIMSLLFNAPLREPANPGVTENPAKAAWYFLNLQELLLHMSAALAGLIIPVLVIVGLMAIPYVDRSKSDVGVWFASKKGKRIAAFSGIYTGIILIALILFDEFIRVRSIINQPEAVPGWIIPIVVIGGLCFLLYVIIRKWQPTRREVLVGFFSAFFVCYFVLILTSLFFRGYGMHLTLPWHLPPGAIPF